MAHKCSRRAPEPPYHRPDVAGVDDKTVVDGATGPAAGAAVPSLPPTGPSDYGSFATSLQSQTSRVILSREEAARSVALLRLIAPIALLAVFAVWIPRETLWRPLCTVSFAVTFLMSLWLLRRFKDPAGFDYRLALLHGRIRGEHPGGHRTPGVDRGRVRRAADRAVRADLVARPHRHVGVVRQARRTLEHSLPDCHH